MGGSEDILRSGLRLRFARLSMGGYIAAKRAAKEFPPGADRGRFFERVFPQIAANLGVQGLHCRNARRLFGFQTNSGLGGELDTIFAAPSCLIISELKWLSHPLNQAELYFFDRKILDFACGSAQRQSGSIFRLILSAGPLDRAARAFAYSAGMIIIDAVTENVWPLHLLGLLAHHFPDWFDASEQEQLSLLAHRQTCDLVTYLEEVTKGLRQGRLPRWRDASEYDRIEKLLDRATKASMRGAERHFGDVQRGLYDWISNLS